MGGLKRNFLTEDKSPDSFSVFFEVTEVNDIVIMAASFGRVVSRGLSSSASLSQLVKTPTPVYGTEGRYAAALYSAASKNKALEAVEKDLKTMTATLGKDAQFAAFLADPSVKKEIEATIALFLKKGQKSLISYEVKPEIMGGMVVSIG